MPLVELRFTHPNSRQRYHSELWETDEATAAELRMLLDREEVQEEFIEDQALAQDSPTSEVIKLLLERGRLLHQCEPTVVIDVYWRRPTECACEDP